MVMLCGWDGNSSLGLALHWPCVTGLVVHPPVGLIVAHVREIITPSTHYNLSALPFNTSAKLRVRKGICRQSESLLFKSHKCHYIWWSECPPFAKLVLLSLTLHQAAYQLIRVWWDSCIAGFETVQHSGEEWLHVEDPWLWSCSDGRHEFHDDSLRRHALLPSTRGHTRHGLLW